jgi:hypothetical protein
MQLARHNKAFAAAAAAAAAGRVVLCVALHDAHWAALYMPTNAWLYFVFVQSVCVFVGRTLTAVDESAFAALLSMLQRNDEMVKVRAAGLCTLHSFDPQLKGAWFQTRNL